jgi:hypothetical protein
VTAAVDPDLVLMAFAGLSSVVLSMALDRLVRPGGAGIFRPLSATAIHVGLFVVCWSALWLMVGRPGVAAALTLGLQGLVVVVSNAKYRALNEPLVFSDFVLYSQVVRFPRFYLPFLGIGRAAAVVLALTAAIAIGVVLEAPWPGWGRGPPWPAIQFGGAIVLLAGGTRAAPRMSLDPVQDLATFGLFPSLWCYTWTGLSRRQSVPPRAWMECPQAPVPAKGRALPDLILLQSESFFDARRLGVGVRPELLAGFDRLRRESLVQGLLSVPAWGANTMRTEFAVLTGIAPDQLGVHRFNPYLSIVRQGLRALPHLLRELGYSTVCVHPHSAGFFGRDRIFPRLGFDAFIDITEFTDAERAGPFVSDAAVMRKVEAVLAAASGPTFVFVISMENHGPLHLEQVLPGDVQRLYRQPPPAGWEDLSVYLRHLLNADRMFLELAAVLAARPRGGLLCLYGDHVPSMPQVYADLGYRDSHTDYLIWSSSDGGAGRGRDCTAHELPETLFALLKSSSAGNGPKLMPIESLN